MAQLETSIPPPKTTGKLKRGRYTATNVGWGMALDLDAADNQTVMSWGFHGQENQQARFFLIPHFSPWLQEELIVAVACIYGRPL
jgi:hypothetical protein